MTVFGFNQLPQTFREDPMSVTVVIIVQKDNIHTPSPEGAMSHASDARHNTPNICDGYAGYCKASTRML